MEEWRDMPGFEQYYSISDQGNVMSKGRRYIKNGKLIIRYPKLMKPQMNHSGYIRYLLRVPDEHGESETHFISAHRKVAEAFIPNVNNLSDVGHKDGVHHHNWKENLFWKSRQDTVNSGTKDNERYKASRIQRSTAVILYNNEKKLRFNSVKEAANFLGVTCGSITCAKRKQTMCKGFFVIEDKERNKDSKENSIVLIDEQGNITFYKSIRECADFLGRSQSAVSFAMKKDTRCNGYRVMRIK